MTTGSVTDPIAAEGAEDILDSGRAGETAIRGGVWRVGSYTVSTLLGIVSAAILVRYLGPRDLGRYTAVVSLMTVVGGVFEAGLTTVGVREYSVTASGTRRRFMANLLGLRLAVAAVGTLVGVAFAVAAGYPDVMVAGAAAAGAGVVVYTVQSTWAVPLHGQLRLGWLSAIELLRQIGFSGFAILFVLLETGLLLLLAVPVPAHLVVLALTIPLVRASAAFLPAFDMREWRRVLALALPFSAATAVGVIYAYVTVLLMSLVASEVETGLFSAGFRIWQVLAVIPGLLVASVLPILARAASRDRDRLRYGAQRTFDVMVLTGVVLALGTVVAAETAIDVVAGDEFEESVDVLRIQGASLLPTALIALGGYALLSVGANRAILVCNLGALAVSSVLTLALSAPWGPEGAAVALLVAETVLAVSYSVALRRQGVALSLRGLPRVGAALMPALGLVAVASPHPLVEGVLAVGVFVVAAAIVRAVPPEIVDALLRRR